MAITFNTQGTDIHAVASQQTRTTTDAPKATPQPLGDGAQTDMFTGSNVFGVSNALDNSFTPDPISQEFVNWLKKHDSEGNLRVNNGVVYLKGSPGYESDEDGYQDKFHAGTRPKSLTRVQMKVLALRFVLGKGLLDKNDPHEQDDEARAFVEAFNDEALFKEIAESGNDTHEDKFDGGDGKTFYKASISNRGLLTFGSLDVDNLSKLVEPKMADIQRQWSADRLENLTKARMKNGGN